MYIIDWRHFLMKNCDIKYFLAANSAEGFVSHFGDCYNPYDGWRAYIIKGGPGTGKSSFMKCVVVKAVDKGYSVELCPCSSDPDSLDGVIIKDIKLLSEGGIEIDEVALNNLRSDYKHTFTARPQKGQQQRPQLRGGGKNLGQKQHTKQKMRPNSAPRKNAGEGQQRYNSQR